MPIFSITDEEMIIIYGLFTVAVLVYAIDIYCLDNCRNKNVETDVVLF